MTRLLKSIVLVFGLLSIASFATNAYFSDQVTATGNQFSTRTLPIPEAKLVINEIDYDQPGADIAEFIELKNVGDAPADLSEYSLKLINGAGGGAVVYQTIALLNINLLANDYYVVCSNNATVTNCDSDAVTIVQNGPADAVALFKNGVIVDTVSYDGSIVSSFPSYVEGSGDGLIDDPNSGAVGISRYLDGTDTNQNNVDFQMRVITPGSPNL